MKFLIDAQLPRRLIYPLREAGHDALHTLDLPQGNRTPDNEINNIAEFEQRIIITKDADFVTSFSLAGRPHKLLLISTGNITNTALEGVFTSSLPMIVEAFAVHSFVELTRTTIILHL